jgi:DNA-binding NarL/FixJ family response regulator
MAATCNVKPVFRCHADLVPLRVLIVDDNETFLAAARVLLEREGIEVVGIASTVADALELSEAARPDVALVDISLAHESGFELARALDEREGAGRPAVILISTHSEADFADLILASPAIGFVPKSELSAAPIHDLLGRRS